MGGCTGRILWAKLKEAQGNFILSKYLLTDITLTQYYHLYVEDVDALLKHWMQRHAAGEIPFQFKKVEKVEQHGTCASEEGDPSTGLGLMDKLEGDQQDTLEAQAQGIDGDTQGNDKSLSNNGQDQEEVTRNLSIVS